MPVVRGGHARETFSLPLFPLRTVLFPGGVLPLKVFEQRYIDMTRACMREERPFGVCLITEGEEVARPGAAPVRFAALGTLATIVDLSISASRLPGLWQDFSTSHKAMPLAVNLRVRSA